VRAAWARRVSKTNRPLASLLGIEAALPTSACEARITMKLALFLPAVSTRTREATFCSHPPAMAPEVPTGSAVEIASARTATSTGVDGRLTFTACPSEPAPSLAGECYQG
jgi:hypothetical protein